MTTPAWIGLGSNLGDRQGILDAAVASLADSPGVIVRAVSSYHETKPVGGPPGQEPFLNAAAHLETTLEPHQLLGALQRIEKEAGRVRVVHWGERTLDLDLLYFGHEFVDSEELTIPHPRVAVRRFVLGPLAEIAATFVNPITGRRIANLLANIDRKPRLLSLFGPGGPRMTRVFSRLVEELPGLGMSEADLGGMEKAGNLNAFQFLFKDIRRKARALKASRWEAETLRVPWIVTDFALELEAVCATRFDLSRIQAYPQLEATLDAYREWRRQISELPNLALPPTFVVVLPGKEFRRRESQLKIPPLLTPESEEPDAIVAEVLATCRGIEGV